MAADPFLLEIVAVVFGLLSVSFILRLLKQPHVVAYILSGVLIGPFGLGLISNQDMLYNLSQLGIVLLMFFVGLEICIPCVVSNWRITILGTAVQVIFSILLAFAASLYFGWSIKAVILLGFVISLSSTAVVIKILQNKRELTSRLGQNVVGILIVQDVAVVPMMVILNILNGEPVSASTLGLNVLGALVLIAFVYHVVKSGNFKLPLHTLMRKDHDLQVFVAFLICFGMAMFAEFFGLSAALGAFIGGITVASSKDTAWVSKSLHPLYIIFTAVFFLFIGMLIDVRMMFNEAPTVLTLVAAIFVINTILNLVTFRILDQDIKESLYAGALLSQIGEFSFILAARGMGNSIISPSNYNLVVLVISLTMLLSPFWIWLIRKWTGVKCRGNVCTFDYIS